MIYIFTALYCEAHVLIEHFHLKKVLENARFQQFVSESGHMLLTISGVGEIAAAVCVSSVCTKRPPERGDFLLNIGTCAGTAKQGSIFLIHKMTEYATGKTFYPDILYRHGFQEAALITGMQVISGPDRQDQEGILRVCLYDMEAAAVYQAGVYFFGPHQMIFLKMISDCGEHSKQSGEFIRQLMEMHEEELGAFMEQLLQIKQHLRYKQQSAAASQSGSTDQKKQAEYSENWIDQLCADLHCSKAMCNLLRQYIRYAALAGIDYSKAVREMYQDHRLPCKDKREGKQRFEEFKHRLLSPVFFTYLCRKTSAQPSADAKNSGQISDSHDH